MNADCFNWTLIVNIAQVAAAIFAGVGLLITANEINKSRTERRLERVSRLKEMLFHDDDLQSIYYAIEYGVFTYSAKFHGSDQEKQLDKLLSMLDILAKQVELKILNLNDLNLIMYEYLVVYRNTDIQKYFEFLDRWYTLQITPDLPFPSFRAIGAQLSSSLVNTTRR